MTNILNSLSREKIDGELNGGLNIGNIFSSYVGTNIDIAKMQKDREF
nr:hypothetical protein [uncultured Campylobacter sp.]